MGYKREDVPSTGGDYFKAASEEFAGKAKPFFTITEVNLEHFEGKKGEADKDKLVISFEETDKKLVVNFANSEILFDELADDTDEWVGKIIQLYVGSTKMGPGVKVKVPAEQPAPKKAGKSAGKKAAPKAPVDPDEDDDAETDDDDEYS